MYSYVCTYIENISHFWAAIWSPKSIIASNIKEPEFRFENSSIAGILCAGLMDSTWSAIVPFIRAVAFDPSLCANDKERVCQTLIDNFVHV